MGNQQAKLLSTLAKSIQTEPRQKAKIVATLTSAKILTAKAKFTGHYSNLKSVVTAVK